MRGSKPKTLGFCFLVKNRLSMPKFITGNNTESCGAVGILLFFLFVSCSGYRLVYSFLNTYPRGPDDTVYTAKMTFHILIFLFGCFELIYSISLYCTSDEKTQWGYSFHIFAMFAFVLAFSRVNALTILSAFFFLSFHTNIRFWRLF